MQQFKVIKDSTGFEVEEYYGAKGVDEWSAKSWEKEISEHDVSLSVEWSKLSTLIYWLMHLFWIFVLLII